MLVMLVMMVVTSCPRGDELSEAADRSVVLSMTVVMRPLLTNLDQWRRTGRAWEEGGGVVEGEEGHDLVPAPWWVKPKPQLLLVLS